MKFSPELKVKDKHYFRNVHWKELDDTEVQSYLEQLAQLGILFAENVDVLERLNSNTMSRG